MSTLAPQIPRAAGLRLARRAARTIVVALLAGTAGVAGPVPAPASASVLPSSTARTASPVTMGAAVPGPHKIVLIGVSGLRLDDVDPRATPTLWALTQEGSIGSVVVRSVRAAACPADGWLAVSAGVRAGDVNGDGTCRTLEVPGATAAVPGWSDYATAAAGAGYDARLGLLGDTLATAGVPAAGIGAGSAIALARSSGHVTSPVAALPADPADLTAQVRTDLVGADLLVIDLGALRDPGQRTRLRAAGPDAAPSADPVGALPDATRTAQAASLDSRVRAVLAGLAGSSGDTTVLLASIADSGPSPHLQLAVATGPSVVPGGTPYGTGWLASTSTRQAGLLQTTDLTPSLLSAVGARGAAPVGVLVGSPVTAGRGPTVAAARVDALIDQDRHAQAIRSLSQAFYTGFVLLNLALSLVVAIGLDGRVLEGRRRGARVAAAEATRSARAALPHVRSSHPPRVLVAVRTAGVAIAAIPAGSFLANASPWWRAASPGAALVGLTLAWAAVIAALALLPAWRRWPLGPAGVVAGVTALLLGADVATGATLQLSAPMGVQPLLGARFYGFNNTAFALFAAAAVLVASAIANPWVRTGRRRLAVAVVVMIGLGATVLDGLPGLGSDLGGPPGLVPGFAVLALLTAGVRLTWRRVLLVLGGGAAAVTFFAVLDWLRPPDSRTHLGRFVQTVLDGGAWPVIARKAGQNLHTLAGSTLSLLATAGLVLVLVLLTRQVRRAVHAPDGGAYAWLSDGVPLRRLGDASPMIRPAVVALAVVLGITFAVNDSGIVIPAVGLGVAFPLLIAATANGLLGLRPERDREPLQHAPE